MRLCSKATCFCTPKNVETKDRKMKTENKIPILLGITKDLFLINEIIVKKKGSSKIKKKEICRPFLIPSPSKRKIAIRKKKKISLPNLDIR
jgi:hypothetical protein